MYRITNHINVILHFYNLNSSLIHPLIDLDGDVELEDYTENIRLNYESIFMRQNFKEVYFNYDDKIKSMDSIFHRYIKNILHEYIFHMFICPNPSPILIDDPYRLNILKSFKNNGDSLDKYILSGWWLHHIDVNEVKTINAWDALNEIENQVKQACLSTAKDVINIK